MSQHVPSPTHHPSLRFFGLMWLFGLLCWLCWLCFLCLPGPSQAQTPSVAAYASPARQAALALWRDDNLAVHPKGSCSGCHGADFFDLAAIGSTSTEITRRAKLDGATDQQAEALVAAVKEIRESFRVKVPNPRSFRPFQPGGHVLLPNLSDAAHIQPVKRDIAFGNQLRTLLPTWFGPRIDSLAAAHKARDEMLDLAHGSNGAGANPQRLNLRSLPTGIPYPLWSADLHHSAAEGTMNDWLSDVALDPIPANKVAWHALQNAYLDNPSTENFWRMYSAVRTMTQAQPGGTCVLDNNACYAAGQLGLRKLRTALMGQHMLRQKVLGRDDFLRGPLAFSYLDTDPTLSFMLSNPKPHQLPADPWHIGDSARVMLADSDAAGSLRSTLGKLGFAGFVINGVDPQRSESAEQQATRLAWFWIGFTQDPSFQRISGSNSTRTAEYLIGSLLEERMFAHNSFMAHMRLLSKGYLQQANMTSTGSGANTQLVAQPTYFGMDYSYFWGYGRPVLKWNESPKFGITFDTNLKAQAAEQWARLTGNGFRMSAWLQMEAFDLEPLKSNAVLRQLAQSTAAGSFAPLREHFNAYHAATLAQEEGLLQMLANKAGVPLPAP
jgi:hypothetical protein